MQIPLKRETRLVTESKDAADWHRRSIADCFQLSLFADKGVEFTLCRLNFGPPNPAKFKQPIQQLPEEVDSRIIVTFKDNLRTKTTQSLPNWRTRCNCREDGAHEILKEATRRQSLRNSFRRKLLLIFSSDDSRRFPSKKCSSAIAPKHE